MNIVQKIKLLIKLNNYFEQDCKEATAMADTPEGPKPGYKTTEFWLQVANQVAMVWGVVSGYVPPKYAIIASAVGTCIYQILRTVAKS